MSTESTKRPTVETGTFLVEFPYVRVGNGPQNLLILPGITLENEPPNRLAAWTYRLGFGHFARNYTVYVINRKPDMPPGYTTQDMAAAICATARLRATCSERRSAPQSTRGRAALRSTSMARRWAATRRP